MQPNSVVGPLNIDSSLIFSLKSQLEEESEPLYLKLKEETNQNLQTDPDYYGEKPCPYLSLRDIYKLIPDLPIRENSYHLRIMYKISTLSLSSPLGELALIINNVVMQHGIQFDRVDLRFERACFYSMAQAWHFDGLSNKRTFSLCWSTRQNWNTHIADPEEIEKVRQDLEFNNNRLTPDSVEKIKSFDQPAKENYLYDVHRVLHRSPELEDLGGEPISQNDWRIFLRFTESH